MKNITNKKLIDIIKRFNLKIKQINAVNFFIYLIKIKSSINLILKFILLFMVLLKNTNDCTSIWDLGDLVLKMVEQESTNVKIDNTNDTVIQTEELTKDTKVVRVSDMEMGEWLDHLRDHNPKAYWFWVSAFCATSVFCVWLMHYLLKPNDWD